VLFSIINLIIFAGVKSDVIKILFLKTNVVFPNGCFRYIICRHDVVVVAPIKL